MNEQYLTAKEIAGTFRRNVRWVYAMKRLGFSMPGGVATVSSVRQFLTQIPAPAAEEKRRFGSVAGIRRNSHIIAERRG